MKPGAETDDVLVERSQQAGEGDLRAFEKLVHRHQETVLTNCRYLTRSSEDSQDLAQEVFMKAYFGLKTFEGRATFRSWLLRIKTNHCLNFIRKKKKADFVDIDDETAEENPELQTAPRAERLAQDLSDRALIEETLDSLPDTLRVPLILRDLDGLPYQDIAQSLGIGLSATKMRIKRAREEFRARYAMHEHPREGSPISDASDGPSPAAEGS